VNKFCLLLFGKIPLDREIVPAQTSPDDIQQAANLRLDVVQPDPMNGPLNIARCVVLSFVGIMAVAYVFILVVKLADKKPKPMMSETSRLVFWLSALGLPALLLGLALAVFPELGLMSLGIACVVGGFLALLGSVFLNAVVAKSKRAAWPVVPAHCTGRQLQKKRFNDGADGWLWQVVCEIYFHEKRYSVSPKIHWSDLGRADEPFWSEEMARQFLSQKISPDGKCKLRVNPDNPLEAELL
jgi:hypothetical protein